MNGDAGTLRATVTPTTRSSRSIASRPGCGATRDSTASATTRSGYGYATELREDANCRAAVHEANARVVADAEAYYRTMFAWDRSSWNVRDRHMDETLDRVRAHLRATRGSDKVVVWAHNSHLGDARATRMGRQGEVNLGQLARERYGDDVCNVGQFTYDGTVTAAHDWGEQHRTMNVNPALPDSYEALLHRVGSTFALDLREPRVRAALGGARLERAIGVIYRPHSELTSHYFSAELVRQFDVAVHLDRTRALDPLDRIEVMPPGGEAPETYPTGV